MKTEIGIVKYIKFKDIYPMINEILEMGKGTRITVTGSSMHPFLRGEIDSVELFTPDFNWIKRGDIVLILRDGGEYILHRVLNRKNECLYIAGDSQCWAEGPIRKEQLIGIVKTIWRKDKKLKCSNILWRAVSIIWTYAFPIRRFILCTYRLIYSIK